VMCIFDNNSAIVKSVDSEDFSILYPPPSTATVEKVCYSAYS